MKYPEREVKKMAPHGVAGVSRLRMHFLAVGVTGTPASDAEMRREVERILGRGVEMQQHFSTDEAVYLARMMDWDNSSRKERAKMATARRRPKPRWHAVVHADGQVVRLADGVALAGALWACVPPPEGAIVYAYDETVPASDADFGASDALVEGIAVRDGETFPLRVDGAVFGCPGAMTALLAPGGWDRWPEVRRWVAEICADPVWLAHRSRRAMTAAQG